MKWRAKTWKYGIYRITEGRRIIADNVTSDVDGEAERHANMLAAAPDLLEALKGLFEHCAMIHKQWGEGSNQTAADDAIKTARAAIARAEGR